MSKNNRDYFYNNPDLDSPVKDSVDTPIEPIPVKVENKEERSARPVRNMRKAKIIALTHNGCIVEEPNGNATQLFGKIYLSKAIGDEVEI